MWKQKALPGSTFIPIKTMNYSSIRSAISLNELWLDGADVLQKAVKAWANANAQLASDELQTIRPYGAIFRRHLTDWICVEVGDNSYIAEWFGQEKAMSSVGRKLSLHPEFAKSEYYLDQSYQYTEDTGSLWYDHVKAKIPAQSDKGPQVLQYQRMLMSCLFPDGTPAIFAVMAPSNNISIVGLESPDDPSSDSN